MTKQEKKVEALRQAAKDLNLDAPDSFWLAPIEELAEIYNGCGPEWMSKFGRAALTWAVEPLEPAILIHDYEFSLSDGSKKSFKAANSRIYANCVKLAKAAYAWYDLWRYRWLRRAVVVWAFCQYGGWSAWTDAYNLKLKGNNA
jgi:hypothetical protein